jgi:PAS domain S-box-containing protein
MRKKYVSLLLFLLALTVIVLVHVEDYRQSSFLIDSFYAVEKSQQTVITINKLASYLKDIQRSHRGYVITQQKEFLIAYENAIDIVPSLIIEIRADTNDHLSQQQLLDSLEVKANQKIQLVEAAIVQVNTGRQQEAIQGIVNGKKLFDQINVIIGRLEANEKQYTDQQRRNVNYRADRNYMIVIAGLVSSSLLLIIAMLNIFMNQKKIEDLSRTVIASNKELEAFNEELTSTNEYLQESRQKLQEVQDSLAYSETQLLQAQRISKTGSIDWNVLTDEIRFTPEFSRILELDTEKVNTFDSIITLVHSDDRESVTQEIESAISERRGFEFECRIILSSKSMIYVMSVSEPYFEEDRVKGFLGTLTDVTTQKKAQEELRLSEEKFRAVLEAAPDPMIITSSEGIIKLLNRQTEKLFQYTREELIGAPLDKLLPYKFKREYFEQRGSYMENPKMNNSTIGMAINALRKDGAEIPIEINFSPIKTAEETLVTAAIRDVSEQRLAAQRILEANEQLEKANQALQKANDELNDFSYSISHDLKAPLRAINGYSAILSEDYSEKLDQNATRALRVIKSNANRMDELINDLLELAKLGTKAITKQRFNMHALVTHIIQDKTAHKQISIELNDLGEATGDPSLIRQVWENLISNAIKFSSKVANPKVEIGCRIKTEELIFWIKDNGAGFDPSYSDKLFKVFSRLHGKNEFEGTGAGLAIAKKIIAAHNGRIWAHSEPKHGATFYFSLPVD